LAGVIGGDPLHDGRQDAARTVVALLLRVTLDLADAVLGLGLRLVDDLADERLPRLGGGEAGDAFELDALLLLELGEMRPLLIELGLARGERLLALLETGHLTIERLLPVEEAALGSLQGGALLT